MPPLAPGTRIGPYEVLSAIGAGGMGEVYRARDTRLDRDVALKILPDVFATDPDRLMRFEREAKVLATLNHPHIAQIHGLEVTSSSTGPFTRALVMELVEGDDLSARIARGAVPLDETLAMARQIAEALEAAHAQGVVHRDLKPANIKVRADGTVKVLDFGLAKALVGESGVGAPTPLLSSPTMTRPGVTGRGVILGTSAYMAPEQARGKTVDQRADIWAFGCVLYEMLAGRRAFPGDEVTDVLAKVIEREPDWSALPSSTPLLVRSLLKRCLRKDPAKRLHHIADARLDLDEALDPPDPGARNQMPQRRSSWIALATAVVAGAVGMGGASLWMRPAPPRPAPRLRVEVPLLLTQGQVSLTSLSPDGRWLAHRGADATGLVAIHLRDLANNQDRTLPGRAEGYGQPAWSPSGGQLLFASTTGLKVVDTASLTVRDIKSSEIAGMSWINEDDIVVSVRGILHRQRVDGGASNPLPGSPDEIRIRPAMLPDGRRYLFLRGAGPDRELCLGSIDTSAATALNKARGFVYGRGRVLLLVAPDGRLQAQRFDPVAGALVGEPVDLSDSVGAGLDPSLISAGVSEDGLIAFVTVSSTPNSDLYWYSRDGKQLTRALESGPGVGLDVSRDARFGVTSVGGYVNPGVFVLDLTRALRSRLTTSPAGDAVMSPDGRQVAYVLVDRRRLDVQAALGGDPRTILTAEAGQTLSLEHWSDDGKYLVVMSGLATERQVLRVPVEGQERPVVLASKLTLIDEMRLSPDGRWLAFNAAVSDRNEVYVSPVPPTGERTQISPGGGTSARWRDDGGELYYLAPDGTLMAVTMAVRDGRLNPAVPVPLFKTGIAPTYNLDHYAVGPGGKTFLLRLPVATNDTPSATLLVNWMP